jgi:hypothetical protein
MNMNTIYGKKAFWRTSVLMLFLAGGLFSCSEDDETIISNSYVEDSNNSLVISSRGIVEDTIPLKYIVRGKGNWKVTKELKSDWLQIINENKQKVESLDGSGVDTIRFIVSENKLVASRSENLLFEEDGNQFAVLKITQQGAEPYLKVLRTGDQDVDPNGDEKFSIPIQSNCDLEFEFKYNDDTSVDWIKIDSYNNDEIILNVEKLDFIGERSCEMTVSMKDNKELLSEVIPITQWNVRTVLNEHFDWMNRYKFEGDAAKESDPENFEYYRYPELGYGLWTEDEKHGHGWGVLNEAEGYVNGGRGYIKLGATNLVGMYASPMLSELKEGSHDIIITFKAIGYTSETGVHDNKIFHVAVSGEGTIVSPETTVLDFNGSGQLYTGAKFELKSYPNSAAERNSGNGYDPWAKPESEFSFRINGATQYTRLIFIGGPVMQSKVTAVKTRMMIDDVVVKAIRQ